MLIVVVIIGILAAALIPRLTSVKDKANDAARKSNIQSIVTAMSSYILDNTVYATATGTDSPALKALLLKWGMSDVPLDPAKTTNTILWLATPGYVYMPLKRNGLSNQGFVIVWDAETAAAANFVECATTDINTNTESNTLIPCSAVTISAVCSSASCSWPATGLRIIGKY